MRWMLLVLLTGAIPLSSLLSAGERFVVTQKFNSGFQVSSQSLPDEFKVTVKTKGTPRPIVWAYSLPPSQCPPCGRLHVDVQSNKDLPFDIVFINPPPNVQGIIAQSGYPLLHWNNAQGTGEFFYGWPMGAMEKLVSKWKQTQNSKPVKSVTRLSYNRNSGSEWTWPGDLREHLQQEHGVAIDGMSDQQLMRFHDQLHNNQGQRARRR